MRKILISILLASAAASPALAQDGRWHRDQAESDRAQAKEERSQAREERQQAREERRQTREERFNGGGNFERAERSAPQIESHQQMQGGGFERPRFERPAPAPERVVEGSEPTPRQSFERRGRWNRDGGEVRTDDAPVTHIERGGLAGDRSGWRRGEGDLRQSDRPVPNVLRTPSPLIVSNTPREGTQPPLRSDSFRRNPVQWSTSWRYNDRYDWRRWRDRHRSWFHVGVYYDPFGWSYRPYRIGWRLWPSYYSSRYWLDNPWYYRLPYAPPGYRWIRYWDDALLVDTWNGEVVDVIRNFFW